MEKPGAKSTAKKPRRKNVGHKLMPTFSNGLLAQDTAPRVALKFKMKGAIRPQTPSPEIVLPYKTPARPVPTRRNLA
jgi:hypothetical protein